MKNCYDPINTKLFDQLSERILQLYGKDIKHQFRRVFKQIIHKVTRALTRRKNKRVMILIGENHEGLISL